ncbi:MAG: Rrf2 family transcriptional regulator [Actinobacteria bacterium]|nr:Rrf2 family transcriptional regulator [Actinomycetota bacterium]
MRISTRTRYGMRLMIYLARNFNNGYSLLKDVAKSESISEKYLSLIVIPLKSAGLLNAIRGSHGGYCLSRLPSEIRIKDIIETMEGDLCLLECVKNKSACERSDNCVSRDLWLGLSNEIVKYLDSLTLADIINMQNTKNEQLVNNYYI